MGTKNFSEIKCYEKRSTVAFCQQTGIRKRKKKRWLNTPSPVLYKPSNFPEIWIVHLNSKISKKRKKALEEYFIRSHLKSTLFKKTIYSFVFPLPFSFNYFLVRYRNLLNWAVRGSLCFYQGSVSHNSYVQQNINSFYWFGHLTGQEQMSMKERQIHLRILTLLNKFAHLFLHCLLFYNTNDW